MIHPFHIKKTLFTFLFLLPMLIYGNEGIRIEHIDSKDGLSHNTVRYIIQDHQGLIWIASVNGLNRFDGYNFSSFYPGFSTRSLSESNIRMMWEDRHAYLWIQTSSRYVNCYNLNNESFVNYTGDGEARQYRSMLEASNGDIWLWGTEQGACRVRHHDSGVLGTLYDKTNIGTDHISFILEDASGNIWAGTDKGLFLYSDGMFHRLSEKISRYKFHSAYKTEEYLCFLTNNADILIYDLLNRRFLPVINYASQFPEFSIHETEKIDNDQIIITGNHATLIFHIPSMQVYNSNRLMQGETIREGYIIRDNKNKPWVYNKSGSVWHYNTESKSFDRYRLIPKPVLSFIDHERYSIFTDSREITWISTYGSGLFAIRKNGEISHYTTTNSDLRTNYLLYVTEDRTGSIWVGTENAGIAKLSFAKQESSQLIPASLLTSSQEQTIRSLYEDRNGNLWAGTKNGDIYIIDSNWNKKDLFTGRQKGIYTIQADHKGNIWMGTKGDGLRIFLADDLSGKSFSYLLSDDLNAGENSIYAILCDTKGRMWVGTFGNGLFLCEWEKGSLHSLRFDQISRTQRQIRSLMQDREGRIWSGGENGVVIFHPDSLIKDGNSYEWYYFDRNDPESLNNNIVKTLYEDRKGRIWLGTAGGGVNLAIKKLPAERYQFTHYTTENGLTNNIIQAILEDYNGNLWISTESGLSKFDVEKKFFENYNFADRWESDYFSESVALRRKNGDILFGSYSGVYVIDPDVFKKQTGPLTTLITDLSINGVKVTPHSQDTPLTASISKTSHLRLRYNQNSFALAFSSLNYQEISSSRYTYILENYDKEWNPITAYNVATYKNIPPGKYHFRVKSVSNTMENPETLLEITIKPSFWRSLEASILYLLSGLLLLYLTVVTLMKMNRLNNEIIIEKKMTAHRLQFFTNISHEFRTPLTLIQGSIESIYEQQLSPALKKQVDILNKSSDKLMRLIDQLLAFRKLQHEEMELRLEKADIVSFLRDIYEIFSETAIKKGIEYTFRTIEDSKVIITDKGKMEMIIFNLLSNAFKHTPKNGKIRVEITFDEPNKHCAITVSDSGIGVPPEKRELLFQRFKQINYTPTGIGIGLHLSAELARVLHGRIDYRDSEWSGACFMLSIPMSLEDYASSEKKYGPVVDVNELEAKATAGAVSVKKNPVKITPGRKQKVLLIEDDEEIRSFLEDKLMDYFELSSASNGLSGLEKAIETPPELIVCDVMMPEMNGFEVTRKIKENFETSHIPVVLLTAYSSPEHQLEGINAGADAYIIKPFSVQYLITRIRKLIEQRERLQYKFAHDPGMAGSLPVHTSGKDSLFMEKIHTVMVSHLRDTQFSVDDFAKEMNMGRTLFYKKIKGITNYSPNEYFRIIRLKKATELLINSEMNVAEIAYEVGFNDPDYFGKSFKKQFGVTPSQFRNGQKS
ncbi:hybrid sensor histidine kinase/response regulator transcription factor [Proteiniphilum sp. UBA1028]|uniref:hybrid sensor histidine kinase/response regulator transcription factor n=1 Tax=Proteiniphilum sp. UBA1028 TaxID=1947251 RepID=UPI0025EED425|nr:hybrid sensor histidine kinase/response regulator transcription factor [Proteiniphilum sp. UBA1028]